MKATVQSPANIALIKHWGTTFDETLGTVVPVASSLSFNLDQCLTTTTAQWLKKNHEISLKVKDQHSGEMVEIKRLDGVQRMVEFIRQQTGLNWGVRIESTNTFPANAGVASSAAGFSALAGALYQALPAEAQAPLKNLTQLCAYSGSFSAPRSLQNGFTRLDWDGQQVQVSEVKVHPDLQLVDLVVLVDTNTKHESSGKGQALAHTSPLQKARIEATKIQIEQMTEALKTGDTKTVLHLTELNSLMLHSVMITQSPSQQYFSAKTWELIDKLKTHNIPDWTWTLDAGANPHLICTQEQAHRIKSWLDQHQYRYLENRPGPGLKTLKS